MHFFFLSKLLDFLDVVQCHFQFLILKKCGTPLSGIVGICLVVVVVDEKNVEHDKIT